jgi:hypothetical protein
MGKWGGRGRKRRGKGKGGEEKKRKVGGCPFIPICVIEDTALRCHHQQKAAISTYVIMPLAITAATTNSKICLPAPAA